MFVYGDIFALFSSVPLIKTTVPLFAIACAIKATYEGTSVASWQHKGVYAA
jgi:hypothetical protein